MWNEESAHHSDIVFKNFTAPLRQPKKLGPRRLGNGPNQGGSRTQSFALWSRAYEPQTTFPAFTVVFTFIAFTPCFNRSFSHCLQQASRAYEPQTTFPAFTVVLIFIAFSSCLRFADRPG